MAVADNRLLQDRDIRTFVLILIVHTWNASTCKKSTYGMLASAWTLCTLQELSSNIDLLVHTAVGLLWDFDVIKVKI